MTEDKPVTHNGRRRIYRVLCHLAWCDGEIHPRERDYLDAFLEEHSIRDDEAISLETEGREGRELGVSKRSSERVMMMDTLIDLAMADGQLVAEEQKRLAKFGATFGLSEQELAKRIVDRVRDSGRSISPTKRHPPVEGQ